MLHRWKVALDDGAGLIVIGLRFDDKEKKTVIGGKLKDKFQIEAFIETVFEKDVTDKGDIQTKSFVRYEVSQSWNRFSQCVKRIQAMSFPTERVDRFERTVMG